jgi:acyl-CoA reductase-like NAD-dependent aldehyde dehydrogenase
MPLQMTTDGRAVVPLVIASKPLPVDASRLWPVTSAKTGETLHYFQSATVADCPSACAAAWQAFSRGAEGERPWKRVGVERRRNLLNRVAELFVERKEELLKAQMDETSCDRPWAENNVDTTVRYLREIAACVSSIRGKFFAVSWIGVSKLTSAKEPFHPVTSQEPWRSSIKNPSALSS